MRPRETRLTAFGGRPPPAGPEPETTAEPPARTVSEIVAAVNRTLAPEMSDVWVRGEVSGFKDAMSGHWYFDLKDGRALLKSAMFASDNARVKFRPEEGIEVLARGRVTVYPDRGSLQLIVKDLRPVGMGDLALAFEQLKKKLAAEGLFDVSRKRPIPRFPRTIAVVTSVGGAALRDILHVATRRHPGMRVLVVDTPVQGIGSAGEIAAAIARVNRRDDIDALIVARGGGSLEDLWAFNEEPVVRAVAASRIPVISAVGHETDITLCDFAADARAATPSAAAETIVPDAAEVLARIQQLHMRCEAALRRAVPDMRQRVDEWLMRAEKAMRREVDRERRILAQRAARLDALSPLGVLSRGYAVVQRGGRIVRASKDAPVGSAIDIRLHEGHLKATVTQQEESPHGQEER